MAEEIQIESVVYDKLLKSTYECSEEDKKSGRIWSDSGLFDERLGIQYLDSVMKKPYSNTIYNFKIINAKKWCFAKLKYNL
jgi:hypothetical protein